MLKFDKEKIRQRGLTFALVILFAWLGVLYIVHVYLRWPLGEELSALIIAVIWLFSLALLDPLTTRYANFETRRYCSQHGHLLENKISGDGRPYVLCNRCYMVMINEPAQHNLNFKQGSNNGN